MRNKFKPTKPQAYEALRKKALQHPEIQAEYEAFRIQYELAKKMRKKREDAQLTQEDLAKLLHTQKPAISRLEATGRKINSPSPSLDTLCRYAVALGYTLKINLVRLKDKSVNEKGG